MALSTIRLTGSFVLGIAAVTLAGCMTMTVESYLAPGVHLRGYHTYDWAPVTAEATGDPRLDNNRFFDERVRAAVDRQLGSNHFERSAEPELLVRYHARVTQEILFERAELEGGDAEDRVPELDDTATLVIELVDARTYQLAWRGWAKGSFEGSIDSQMWMEKRIDEAVKLIMQLLANNL
jgi:hypothetical protein